MESEKTKMLTGKPYKAFGEELLNERQAAKELVFDFNHYRPSELTKRNYVIKKLLGKTHENFFIEPPFRCDYGYNIEIGDHFYSNYNLIILDCAKVTIGHHVLIGPNVALYTAGHPLHHEKRNEEYEYALPITIGNNVWIGGNTVINPGISIGDNTVVGSGSVVTKDLPANVIAVGNPCKVLRAITDADKPYCYKGQKFE
ncbi:sugar O-acetyltransferase [Reichenbachiella carrageenanivorans]|uniref:Acetyltransferase n=1 Tax=Reichenbachiella carrageenanivorans TaxID=2979869 RepID=A0ABY6CWJ8_9BACT|nr:sugar O-acetyltransferase [Reichenbachiella carrageenanivorans]UXX78280.1 sugar O-acetyltransferase [Reichenbachiella carrageenanivorans]